MYGQDTPTSGMDMYDRAMSQLWAEVTLDDDHSYAEWTMNGMENAATAGIGSGAFVGGAAVNGGKKAADTMMSSGADFNDWAQGLSDPIDGVYPYTRDDEL